MLFYLTASKSDGVLNCNKCKESQRFILKAAFSDFSGVLRLLMTQ